MLPFKFWKVFYHIAGIVHIELFPAHVAIGKINYEILTRKAPCFLSFIAPNPPSLGICNTLCRGVPGQQALYYFYVIHIRGVCCFQQPGQVLIGIQPILNGGLDQAEHNGASFRSLGRVGKQEVLPVNDKGLDTSLCPVIAQFQSAIF